MTFLGRISIAAILACSGFGVAGCANRSISATEFKKYEAGELTRAESGVLISQQAVVVVSALPFNTGPGKAKKARGEKSSRNKRAISYYVKLDRTGETVSITQSDDVYIANGASVWVQFGERTRVFPK